MQPVAAVAPKLLSKRDSRLLLADPPDRARHNRCGALSACCLMPQLLLYALLCCLGLAPSWSMLCAPAINTRCYISSAAFACVAFLAARRECFLDILCEEGGDFLLEEAGERGARVWEESKSAWRQVPIAMMHLRRSAGGGETVGPKLLTKR
jgi:hypothetical protein